MSESIKRLSYALVVAVTVMTLFFASIPDVEINDIAKNKKRPFVKLTDESDNKRNDISIADLNDYAPMFLPTKWNYSGKKHSHPKTAQWDIQNAPISTTSEEIKVNLPHLDHKNNSITKTIFMRSAFANFGKREQNFKEIQKQNASLIVKNLSTGKDVLELKIPQNQDIKNGNNVLEFHLRVLNSMQQAPILKNSYGNEDFENQIRQFIKKELTTLPDGEFKIIVIP